jgi:hypothetical protein
MINFLLRDRRQETRDKRQETRDKDQRQENEMIFRYKNHFFEY